MNFEGMRLIFVRNPEDWYDMLTIAIYLEQIACLPCGQYDLKLQKWYFQQLQLGRTYVSDTEPIQSP